MYIPDHEMLASILTQTPPTKDIQLKIRLTPEEMQRMTEFAQKKFDLIMETLKEMPRSLLLVVR